MKVYVDKQNMKLLGVEKERPFYTGDIFSSSLTVYFNTDVSNSSVTLSFLLANGRTPRKNLIPDDARTITLSEEKFGQSTWYSYTWELSAKEGLLVTPGPIQMTLTVTTNDVVEQVMFTNNVVRTSRFGANENLVVFGDDPEEIILDFATNIANINASLYKFRYIGEFNTKGSMYQAAFEEIYTNNYSMVSARFYDNVFIFLRSDAEGEQYLFMIDSSLYKYYKLKNDGTMIETDGANLSGFIYLTSASGTLSADQIENVNKNLCYILYNNRVYQKNSSTIDSMTFVNYDLLYSDDVFNAARYTITITISGNTYSYASSSKLVETYTKEQINSLLNSKIYYNDIVDNVTSDEIRKPLSAKQGKVLKGLITSVESDLSGNYLRKKPDGTNDIVSNGKVSTRYLPDFLLGQLLFGGTFNATSAVATLTTNAKSKLGVSSNTLTLTNDSTQSTGYASNEGTFFVVEASGTFAGIEFATGDWLISIGTAWKKVDNTDEVTSVNGQTGNVTTGTYDKPEDGIPASDLAQAVQDALNKANSSVQDHQKIKVLKTDNETALTPGSSEEIKGNGTINLHKISKTGTYADLIGKPTLGTAASHDVASEISLNNNDLVTSGQLYVALRDMPVPMVFKGTLGQNATISSLPTASSENNGFTYKVVTAGTYAGLSCAVGDLVVSNGELWIVIPAGDEAVTEDTWRGIKVNGTTLLANGITTGDLKIVEGTNVTITTNANNEIIFSATDTTYDNLAPAKDGENVSLITTGDKYKILQSLYNLGAFDTISGNTITRQTGATVFKNLTWGYRSDWGLYYSDGLVGKVQPSNTTWTSTNLIRIAGLAEYVAADIHDLGCAVENVGRVYVSYSAGNGDITALLSMFGESQIQYKLATPYTEDIIEGESILPLDTTMAQMIRQDVVESLNLLKEDIVKVSNSSIKLGYCELKANTTYYLNIFETYTGSRSSKVILVDSNGTENLLGESWWFQGAGSFIAPSDLKGTLYLNATFTDTNPPTKAMLNKGSHPYPHETYHASKHITDDEATLLKKEEEKCRNLFGQSLYQGGWDYDNNRTKYSGARRVGKDTKTIVSPNTTYTITNSGNKQISIQYRTSAGAIISGSNWQDNNYTFTTPSNCSMIDIIFRNSDDSNLTPSQVGNVMLNEGTEAKPYQEWNGEIVHEKQLQEVEAEIPTNLSQLSDDSTHRLVTDTEKFKWNSASDTYPIYDGSPIWVDGNRYGTTSNGIYICYPMANASISIRAEGKLDSSWIYIWSKTDVATKPFILWIDTSSNKVRITYLDGSTPEEYAVTFSSSTLSRVSFQTSGYALVKKLLNVNDNISYTKDN